MVKFIYFCITWPMISSYSYSLYASCHIKNIWSHPHEDRSVTCNTIWQNYCHDCDIVITSTISDLGVKNCKIFHLIYSPTYIYIHFSDCLVPFSLKQNIQCKKQDKSPVGALTMWKYYPGGKLFHRACCWFIQGLMWILYFFRFI